MSKATYHIERHTKPYNPKKPFAERFWWTLVNDQNGQTEAHSEMYAQRAKRNRSSQRVADAARFPIRKPK